MLATQQSDLRTQRKEVEVPDMFERRRSGAGLSVANVNCVACPKSGQSRSPSTTAPTSSCQSNSRKEQKQRDCQLKQQQGAQHFCMANELDDSLSVLNRIKASSAPCCPLPLDRTLCSPPPMTPPDSPFLTGLPQLIRSHFPPEQVLSNEDCVRVGLASPFVDTAMNTIDPTPRLVPARRSWCATATPAAQRAVKHQPKSLREWVRPS